MDRFTLAAVHRMAAVIDVRIRFLWKSRMPKQPCTPRACAEPPGAALGEPGPRGDPSAVIGAWVQAE